MHPAGRRTFCEWKGHAVYHDLAVGESLVEAAAWSYPDPTAAFVPIRDYLAFHASRSTSAVWTGKSLQPSGATSTSGGSHPT